MKKLFKKDQRGFTLAELLIVVAIIGVLVAVSIPFFTSQLEKAREATDLANMRAAFAEGSAEYLSADLDDTKWKITSGKSVSYYDAGSGKLVLAAPTTGYGKGTTLKGSANNAITIGGTAYKPTEKYTDAVIMITVTAATGEIKVEWTTKGNKE